MATATTEGAEAGFQSRLLIGCQLFCVGAFENPKKIIHLDTNLFDGYQNVHTFKRIAKIESIQIPKINSILFNQSAECQVKRPPTRM